MCIRDRDGVEFARLAAGRAQPALSLASAEPAVEQHPRGAGAVDAFDQQRVAFAAAAETCKTHRAVT